MFHTLTSHLALTHTHPVYSIARTANVNVRPIYSRFCSIFHRRLALSPHILSSLPSFFTNVHTMCVTHDALYTLSSFLLFVRFPICAPLVFDLRIDVPKKTGARARPAAGTVNEWKCIYSDRPILLPIVLYSFASLCSSIDLFVPLNSCSYRDETFFICFFCCCVFARQRCVGVCVSFLFK